MNKYVLDTNIASIVGSNDKITDKLASLQESDVVLVSVITIYETKYGFKNNKDETIKAKILQNINFLEKYFKVIALDLREADLYADLKSMYKNSTGITKNDAKKNDADLLIASSVIAENAILVSNDKIFKRLAELEPRLQVENWLEQ